MVNHLAIAADLERAIRSVQKDTDLSEVEKDDIIATLRGEANGERLLHKFLEGSEEGTE